MFRAIWRAFKTRLIRLANWFWETDPVDQMRLEYDNALDQLKEGRKGLEQYRALLGRVSRQVKTNEKRVSDLTTQIRALLDAGDRDMAAQLAAQLGDATGDFKENQEQLALHEASYANHAAKVQAATRKLIGIRKKIQKYDMELRMSEAEAEVNHLARNFEFDITSDFDELEHVIQEKIDLNRAKARLDADLSDEKLTNADEAKWENELLAEGLLAEFEAELNAAKAPDPVSREDQARQEREREK